MKKKEPKLQLQSATNSILLWSIWTPSLEEKNIIFKITKL